ncbi:hypothetical protein HQQ81_03510 [Microbacteriaceae bacterium VKM Ac-2854]|nr:hypothetical protein [Microbacteriaceae bacterium VKM Ac-2854]
MFVGGQYLLLMWWPLAPTLEDFAGERLLHAGFETVSALERFVGSIRAGDVAGRRPNDRVADAVEGETVPDRLIPYLLMFDVPFDTEDPERMRRFRTLADLAERRYGAIERS